MIVSLARRASWLPAAALAVLLTFVPAGQARIMILERPDPPLPPAFLEGTHIFRNILNRLKLIPLTKVEELKKEPGKTILIVHGDPKNRLGSEDLKTFVGQGGAVLFASDQAVADADLKSVLSDLTGYSISGSSIICEPFDDLRGAADFEWGDQDPLKLQRCYRNFPQCPYLVPAAGAAPNLLSLGGVREERGLLVATNRPSYLVLAERPLVRSRLQPLPALAHLPDHCTLEPLGRLMEMAKQGNDYVRRLKERIANFLVLKNPPVVVGGERDSGRILLVADHSIFINMMMLPTDTNKTDNVEFACNCLDYLRAPHGADRDKVLFLEEGEVNSNFNIPLKQIPGLSEQGLRALLGTMNERLAHLEDQNAFNRAVSDWLERHTTGSDLLQAVLILLTLALLGWVVWRLPRTRGFRPEQAVPLLAETTGATVPAPLLEQRQLEILKSGNLWESGRQVARETFLSAGMAVTAGPLKQPVVKVSGGLWQRWSRRRQVLRLWRLAFDPRPFRVRPGAWPGLLVELEQLQADLANGSVQVSLVISH